MDEVCKGELIYVTSIYKLGGVEDYQERRRKLDEENQGRVFISYSIKELIGEFFPPVVAISCI